MAKILVNLQDFVKEIAKLYGDRDVYRYKQNGQTVSKTYKQFERDINAVASWMTLKGWQGKHVAILGGSSYSWVVTFLAICNSGNVAVPIDRLLPAEDIQNLMVMGDVDFVFLDEEFEVLMQPLRDADNQVEEVFSFTGSRYREMLRTEKVELPKIDVDAMTEILFTSGTTGMSKGVMISQRNIVANINDIRRMDYTQDVQGNPIVMSVLPIHHTFELTVDNLGVMYSGATICINDKLENIVSNLQEFKPAVINVVPAIAEVFYKKIMDATSNGATKKKINTAKKINRVMSTMKFDVRRSLYKSLLSRFGGNLTHVVVGGAALRPEIVTAFDEFGINIFQGYGLTECAPLVAANYPYHNKTGSVGQIVKYMQAKVVDNEILVKGPGVMLGYYKNEEATREAIDEDGWFHTGDLGYIDDEGYLFITGRSKNLIILDNGKNIYPEELEELVRRIEGVKECMVYNDEGKLSVLIFPTIPGDTQQAYEIKKAIRAMNEKLPSYKKIVGIRFRLHEFPKTTTLKIKRKEVMEWLHEHREEEVSNYVPARSAQQKLLVESFERALGRRKIGIKDDFFSLGGDSLSACVVAAEVGVSVQDIYENPTIEQLEQAMIAHQNKVSEEVHIDVNALIRHNSNLEYKVAPKYVLLTGATGFLGAHILRELIKRKVNVVCLVRDEAKLEPTLKYYFPKEYEKFRYKTVRGDIERERFGVSDKMYKNLIEKVDMVIHTAANVKHAGYYEDLERINVIGTQHVIDFCREAGAVLQYTSTASVHGAGTCAQSNPDAIFNEFNLDIGQEYTQNVYIHSKYVAEERVLQAREEGLKVNIYRIGNLTWRKSDGKFQKNAKDNGFVKRVNGLMKLGMYSSEMAAYPIDFTPVDECADAYVRLALYDRVNNIYNLYNPNMFYIENLCSRMFVHIKKVPKDVLERNMKNMIEDSEVAVLSFYNTIANTSKNIQMNNDFTVNELKKLGFHWSKISLWYLSYIKKIK